MGVAWVSKYALQVPVHGRCVERVSEQLGNKKAIIVIPTPFFACAFINNYIYTKEDEEYNQGKNSLLTDCSLTNEEFRQI